MLSVELAFLTDVTQEKQHFNRSLGSGIWNSSGSGKFKHLLRELRELQVEFALEHCQILWLVFSEDSSA